MKAPGSPDFEDREPALSWETTGLGDDALHFHPVLWSIACQVARMMNAPTAQTLILDALRSLIQGHTVAATSPYPKLELNWVTLYATRPDDATEALLVFQGRALWLIGELWRLSLKDTKDRIAVSLLETLAYEQGEPGHA